jgi:hypothetical protein
MEMEKRRLLQMVLPLLPLLTEPPLPLTQQPALEVLRSIPSKTSN